MYLCRRQNLAEERFRSPLKFYLLLFPLPPLPLRSSVFFNFPFFTFFPQALLTELRLFGYDLKVISLPPRGWVNSPLFHVSREFCFVKLICRNLDALFSHVRNAYIANQNGVQLSFDMEVWSVLTHMASIYANFYWNKLKESICIRKQFNSQRTGLGHQHGRRFIVFGRQYGLRDVM